MTTSKKSGMKAKLANVLADALVKHGIPVGRSSKEIAEDLDAKLDRLATLEAIVPLLKGAGLREESVAGATAFAAEFGATKEALVKSAAKNVELAGKLANMLKVAQQGRLIARSFSRRVAHLKDRVEASAAFIETLVAQRATLLEGGQVAYNLSGVLASVGSLAAPEGFDQPAETAHIDGLVIGHVNEDTKPMDNTEFAELVNRAQRPVEKRETDFQKILERVCAEFGPFAALSELDDALASMLRRRSGAKAGAE